MKWKLKAATQAALSVAPFGPSIHYQLQRRVTRSLPVGDETLDRMIENAKTHFAAFQRWKERSLATEDARFFEFGAGWDLVTAITHSVLGIRHQTVTDAYPLLRPELVRHTLDRLKHHEPTLPEGNRCKSAPAGSLSRSGFLRSLEREFGIAYHSPVDPASTEIPDMSIDFISSTHTLEHVPADRIVPILSECRRILKDGGVVSFHIDYRDHYAYSDRSISIYNFLRYTNDEWKRFNSVMCYQNRLRHSDYCHTFEKAGFRIVSSRIGHPDQKDLSGFDTIALEPGFRNGYELSDLLATGSHVVLLKRGPDQGESLEDQ